MEVNQLWDVGELIDLGGKIHHGMRGLPEPMPEVEVHEIDLEEYCRQRQRECMSHTQKISMCVQTSTYLETGAHVFPEMEKIDQVGLDRLVVTAVILQIPREPNQKVYAADIETQLAHSGETINPGDAVLVSTGFNAFEQDLNLSPHFSYDAVELVVDRKASILGADMYGFHDVQETPSFFPMLMKSGTLVLAPLVNLEKITVPRIRMIVTPLKIEGVCASPCRVIGILPSRKKVL